MLGHEGNFAVFLASGFHGDLDVLAEGGEKVHETLDGKGTGAVAHQGGNVRLLDGEDLASFGLLEAAFSKEAINLERKLCLQEFLLGMGETEVGKNISTAFFDLIGFLVLVATLVLPFSMEAFLPVATRSGAAFLACFSVGVGEGVFEHFGDAAVAGFGGAVIEDAEEVAAALQGSHGLPALIGAAIAGEGEF